MRIVRIFIALHASLGRWFWFILVTLALISLHTFDHTTAVFTDRSPFAESFISDTNTEGFVLWHGGLTIADYAMTLVLLTHLYYTWTEPRGSPIERPSLNPARILRKLHRVLGKTYWLVWAALIPITVHTEDHIIAMILNTSPLSDTIVANSINHEGFLVWHSSLTILDYALTIVLLRLVYVRWEATHLEARPASDTHPRPSKG